MFILCSDITIGTFRFSGVHEVRVRRSLHSVVDTASITIPSIGTVQPVKLQSDGTFKYSGNTYPVITGKLFQDGEPVTIKLGYNGDLKEEFRGFVKRRIDGMPLIVQCEGYCRQLELKVDYTANFSKKTTTAKDLLLNALQGTDISVQAPQNFTISGITLKNANGKKICDWIKEATDHTVTLFFIEPDVLWMGLVYTPTLAGSDVFGLPTVNYQLGYNCIKDNNLKERVPSEPVQVFYNGKLASGLAVHTSSKDKAAMKKLTSLMNHVPVADDMKSFAQEKADTQNYTGYEGGITAFLQPYCLPGYKANIVDERYKERTGVYIIESTEVVFGIGGARRIVGIGPKVGDGK